MSVTVNVKAVISMVGSMIPSFVVVAGESMSVNDGVRKNVCR